MCVCACDISRTFLVGNFISRLSRLPFHRIAVGGHTARLAYFVQRYCPKSNRERHISCLDVYIMMLQALLFNFWIAELFSENWLSGDLMVRSLFRVQISPVCAVPDSEIFLDHSPSEKVVNC